MTVTVEYNTDVSVRDSARFLKVVTLCFKSF
jgi:hypothetical protein